MIGGSPDHRQPRGEVYAFPIGQRFEWDQTLVMVHRQHSVKTCLISAGKECIGAVRTEYHHLMFGVLDHRLDDLFLFFSDQAFIPGVRVQTEDGYLWLVDA